MSFIKGFLVFGFFFSGVNGSLQKGLSNIVQGNALLVTIKSLAAAQFLISPRTQIQEPTLRGIFSLGYLTRVNATCVQNRPQHLYSDLLFHILS